MEVVELAGEAPPAFVWRSGARGDYRMPESIGGGVALLDAEGDGDLDIFFAQGGDIDQPEAHRSVLWRNDGEWKFTDVSAESGAALPGYAMGVATGDIDGDGDVDLIVARLGAVDLLLNDSTRGGAIRLQQQPVAGVTAGAWPSVVHLSDLDSDGDLDLFVGRYLEWTPGAEPPCEGPDGKRDYCSPRSFSAPAASSIYMNNGRGSFSLASASGVDSVAGAALGAIAADFTGDGKRDIFVANDAFPNRLWVQQAHGSFRDEAPARGCAVDLEGRAKAGMGVGCEDIDGNGWFDLLVCNLDGESDSLFLNDRGRFTDATARAGLRGATRRATRFGLLLADFDENGALDILEACGRVSRDPGRVPATDDPYAQLPLLLMGMGDGVKFQPRADGVAGAARRTGRGAAMGDLDGDGDLDAVIVNRDAPATLLRNLSDGSRGVTIEPRLASGAAAMDAVIELSLEPTEQQGNGGSTSSGSAAIRRLIQSGRSYFGASAPQVRVAVPAGYEIGLVRVLWPDGSVTEANASALGIKAGGRVVIQQPEAQPSVR